MQRSPLTCADVERLSYVERFLARTLSDDDSEGFESHFLTCDRCQQALTVGAATRASLRRSAVASTPLPSGASLAVQVARASAARRWIFPMSTAAAVLVAVFGYRAATSSSRDLQPLAAVAQAPIYLGIPVRAGNDEHGMALFDAAMTQYAAQDWQTSAQGLRAAIAAGKSDAPVHFFLGAALLMQSQALDAAAEFSLVVGAGATPYTYEALLYRAKAHLQLRERQEAIADLARIVENDAKLGDVPSSLATHARALRDSIQAVGVR